MKYFLPTFHDKILSARIYRLLHWRAPDSFYPKTKRVHKHTFSRSYNLHFCKKRLQTETRKNISTVFLFTYRNLNSAAPTDKVHHFTWHILCLFCDKTRKINQVLTVLCTAVFHEKLFSKAWISSCNACFNGFKFVWSI